MKNTILSAVILAIVMVSCNQKNTETETQNVTTEEMKQPVEVLDSSALAIVPLEDKSDVEAPTVTEIPKVEVATATSKFSLDAMLTQYIFLKNALVKDDAKSAAKFSENLFTTIKNADASSLTPKQKKEVLEIMETAREHTEHISKNADKIEHQREHFVMLSKDMNDLIAMFGSKKKLYQDFCPMANNGNGAIWISESKDIRNPYYGSSMLTCGSVKKEL